MKNKLNFIVLNTILLLMPLGILFAQSQSMLLPVPANAQIINFTEANNPVITTLPFHEFTYNNGTPNGNPHIEGNLENSDIYMDEEYLSAARFNAGSFNRKGNSMKTQWISTTVAARNWGISAIRARQICRRLPPDQWRIEGSGNRATIKIRADAGKPAAMQRGRKRKAIDAQ